MRRSPRPGGAPPSCGAAPTRITRRSSDDRTVAPALASSPSVIAMYGALVTSPASLIVRPRGNQGPLISSPEMNWLDCVVAISSVGAPAGAAGGETLTG